MSFSSITLPLAVCWIPLRSSGTHSASSAPSTYIWDQASYNPITGEVINHIDFTFPNGSEIKKAFTYHWRLWTLPEIRELLEEAGFSTVLVYWEGTDEETGEGNSEWAVSDQGEACEGWIAYIVASK